MRLRNQGLYSSAAASTALISHSATAATLGSKNMATAGFPRDRERSDSERFRSTRTSLPAWSYFMGKRRGLTSFEILKEATIAAREGSMRSSSTVRLDPKIQKLSFPIASRLELRACGICGVINNAEEMEECLMCDEFMCATHSADEHRCKSLKEKPSVAVN